MRIELATKSDIDVLVSLFNQTIDESKDGYTYLMSYIKDRRIRILKNDQDSILGAYIYHISRYSNPYTQVLCNRRVAWLDQIMVFPRVQQKGYGKELLKDFLSMPIKEFRLVCLQSLITYYQQFKFEEVESGTHKDKQYFIMRKCI